MLVDLGPPPPPRERGQPKYGDYKDWLHAAFFDRLCAYCLLHDRFVQIEHIIPQTYNACLAHDPANLLLGCYGCNRQKSDYPPLYAARRRLPLDTTGFAVIDVRADDFAELYRVDAAGIISAADGPHKARAEWNVALLGLDVRYEARQRCLRILAAAERCCLSIARDDATSGAAEEILVLLLPEVVATALFFKVYGIPFSPELAERVELARPRAAGA